MKEHSLTPQALSPNISILHAEKHQMLGMGLGMRLDNAVSLPIFSCHRCCLRGAQAWGQGEGISLQQLTAWALLTEG